MLFRTKLFTLGLLCCLNVSLSSHVYASSAGIDDPASAAKLMRAGAKANQMMKGSNTENSDDSSTTSSGSTSGCGGVNVGNVYTDKKGSNPKEVITVIKGDVINTGKCKK